MLLVSVFTLYLFRKFTNGRFKAATPGRKCHEKCTLKATMFCGLSGVTSRYSEAIYIPAGVLN